MKVTVTYILDEELKVYSASLEGVPVYGEGKTKAAALQSLRAGLELFVAEEGEPTLLKYVDWHPARYSDQRSALEPREIFSIASKT